MFEADPGRPVAEMLLAIGRRLRHRPDAGGYLQVEALVAARRDEDVARPMRDYMGERADWLAQLIRGAQANGELDPTCPPRRSPTSACCSRWAARSSPPTRTRSTRTNGRSC